MVILPAVFCCLNLVEFSYCCGSAFKLLTSWCRLAYLDFNDSGSFNKALELNGVELDNNYLTVEEAKPRSSFNDRNNSGGRSSNRSGRGPGRFGGGRDRGRGRGRSTPNKPSLTPQGIAWIIRAFILFLLFGLNFLNQCWRKTGIGFLDFFFFPNG